MSKLQKVFVANPKKPQQIETILRRNKDKLLIFLKDFHNDKDGTVTLIHELIQFRFNTSLAIDEQFTDEKQFLVVQIQGL